MITDSPTNFQLCAIYHIPSLLCNLLIHHPPPSTLSLLPKCTSDPTKTLSAIERLNSWVVPKQALLLTHSSVPLCTLFSLAIRSFLCSHLWGFCIFLWFLDRMSVPLAGLFGCPLTLGAFRHFLYGTVIPCLCPLKHLTPNFTCGYIDLTHKGKNIYVLGHPLHLPLWFCFLIREQRDSGSVISEVPTGSGCMC